MRHLLSAEDLDTAAAVQVLDTAAAMAQTQSREIKKLPTLRGRTVVAVRLCASGPSLAEANDLMQVPRAQLGPALLDTITTLPAHDLDPISADPTTLPSLTIRLPLAWYGKTICAIAVIAVG